MYLLLIILDFAISFHFCSIVDNRHQCSGRFVKHVVVMDSWHNARPMQNIKTKYNDTKCLGGPLGPP